MVGSVNVAAHYMDAGGYLVLGKGNLKISEDVFLMVSSAESYALRLGNGRVLYKGIFNMDVNDVTV